MDHEAKIQINRMLAARSAMRVWPALAGFAKVPQVDEKSLEAIMRLPWLRVFETEFEVEQEAMDVRSKVTAAAAVADVRVAHGLYVATNSEVAARAAFFAAAIAFADGAFDDDACNEAASFILEATIVEFEQYDRSLVERARGAARDAAQAAALADSQLFNELFYQDAGKSNWVERCLQTPLWFAEMAPYFQEVWSIVEKRWAAFMKEANLGIWVERYYRACERGFAWNEARNWFLGDRVRLRMPLGNNGETFAGLLYHFGREIPDAWEAVGDPSITSLSRLLESVVSKNHSPDALRRELKERNREDPPDPLWLSWFVETRWEVVRPMAEEAWKRVYGDWKKGVQR